MIDNPRPQQSYRYRKTGLVLSVWRLSLLSLPFRALPAPRVPGFQPGLRNIVVYELRRLWHRIFESDRLLYTLQRLRRFGRR
ncbi:hypothetical protein [Thioalkalivibrio paradoxus]|uniref:Uncharacterized protein n=1 Tax=Thioalkalivibrio paradoxus ARh 1 TaxID=713585 RepID=W0DTB3_9GAMM|nr:hypothetical protein [Thioalkalivibrio paradoxus]AHF00204.1 hypothetical protein THITH_12485 [Thioalkalivibrio paradoxus ARh 1]